MKKKIRNGITYNEEQKINKKLGGDTLGRKFSCKKQQCSSS